MPTITFSIWKPFVENTSRGERWIQPTLSDFEKTVTSDIDHKKGLYHVEVEKTSKYVYIIIETGNLEPRDATVTDYYTREKRENPRLETELEFLKQCFVLFDFESNLLYFSNVKNKGLIEQILHRETNRKFSIKGIYEDMDEFLSILSKVDEIQFTSKDDIFSTLSDKRQALSDLLDTDSFRDLTMNLKMAGVPKEKLFKFFNRLRKSLANQELSGILIRGNDESGFEHVFNRGSFIKKLTVEVDKQEETGKYLGTDVKNALINQIGVLTNAKTK